MSQSEIHFPVQRLKCSRIVGITSRVFGIYRGNASPLFHISCLHHFTMSGQTSGFPTLLFLYTVFILNIEHAVSTD